MNSVWADTIFVLGYYFLNEINAAPSLVGMAQMLTRTSNDLVGAISNYFKVNSLVITKYLLLCFQSIQTAILTSRSVDTTHDRIDDIMYSLPGP